MTIGGVSDNILQEVLLIRRTSKTTDKKRIIKRNASSPMFRSVLYYTYNPFIRFHIRKIPKDIVTDGVGEINRDTWVLLNKLALRKITGLAARETLFDYIETLSPAAAKLLTLIVQKDLKAGISTKTINACIPGLIPSFECQLIEEWVESRITYPILIGPKIDGTRGEKRGNNLFTRSGHVITGVNHIVEYMSTVNPSMSASGELFIPGMPFRRSNGIVRSNKPDKSNVRYALFDAPDLTEAPLKDRLAYIAKTFYPLETRPLPPVCHIPHVWAYNKAEVDRMYNYWRSRGYEGLVGKDPEGLVAMGRNFQWMRKVPGISAEYRIIDVYESVERPGYLGGIVIEGGIRVGSGFVDSERKMYLSKPSLIIGKLATIEAKEKTAAGSLRQPIFKAIRWDI